jgi:Lon protease-like protein
MNATTSLPLFLLHAVLVPGQRLPLKVFEPRYLDMASRCLKNSEPFGICLIKSGKEVGAAGEPYTVGTLAHIEQWEMPQSGILHLQVRGGERFSVVRTEKHGELVVAEVELWPPEPELEVPSRYAMLVDFLQQVLEGRDTPGEPQYTNAAWVSWRLAELLPVINEIRQRWLEQRDPVMRLGDILDTLGKLAEGLEE